ncbi:MAG: hypothetical protein ACREOX_01980 [Stenotrophomonas sp.]
MAGEGGYPKTVTVLAGSMQQLHRLNTSYLRRKTDRRVYFYFWQTMHGNASITRRHATLTQWQRNFHSINPSSWRGPELKLLITLPILCITCPRAG